MIDLTDCLIAEPEEVYAAKRADHLSSHALADFRACPRLYRDKQLGLISEPERDAFILGRAAHCLTLEGAEEFATRFATGGPINPKTGRTFGRATKAYAQWAAEQDRPVISEEDATLCERLANSVRSHPIASALLAEGMAEGVARCMYGGMMCQARIDWTGPHGMVDLKTIDDVDRFWRQAQSFGYIFQMSFYRALLREASGQTCQVHMVAVEKREPYRCGVWHIDGASLDRAERINLAAMHRLRACKSSDEWPTGYEEVRELTL